jgi:hypothetical protein
VSSSPSKRLIAFPIIVGLALSALLAILIVYLGFISRCTLLESGVLECRRNYEWLLDSPPNEIGDTIAGIFATLAFVWIVVTVFLQSAELSEQREELALTREELKLSRLAQEKQVEAAQIQADIFKDEKRAKEQALAFSEVSAIVDAVSRVARSRAVMYAKWLFTKEIGGGNTSSRPVTLVTSPDDFRNITDFPELARELGDYLSVAHSTALSLLREGWTLTESPYLKNELDQMREMLDRIERLYDEVSSADQVRVLSLNSFPLLEEIQEIENHPEYWRIWC